MDNSILTFLLHNKSCVLPGIGTLKVITTSSERDFGNFHIKAPLQTIVLLDEISDSNNQFSSASDLIKNKLDEEGHFELEGLGAFTKKQDDHIRFVPISLPKELFQAVAAEKVIRQDVPHDILVGDRETNNIVMADYLNNDDEFIAGIKIGRWWISAAVLLGIVILALAIRFTQKNTNSTYSGNVITLGAGAPEKTYTEIK